MPFVIRVFNTQLIAAIDPNEILAAITESNYQTLCQQYGLDPALIAPGLARLGVLTAPDKAAPFFTIVYRQNGERPLVVSLQDWAPVELETRPSEPLREVFSRSVQLVSIELGEDQLRDLGLLLAYEVARWAAVEGRGIIQGLDGRWYRLSAHKAFLPVDALD